MSVSQNGPGSERSFAIALALFGAVWMINGVSRGPSGSRTAAVGGGLLVVAGILCVIARVRRDRQYHGSPYPAFAAFWLGGCAVLVYTLTHGVKTGNPLFVVAAVIGLIAAAYLLIGAIVTVIRSRAGPESNADSP